MILESENRSIEVIVRRPMQISSSSGNLRKWECEHNGKPLYVKEASESYAYECESECIAYELATLFGLRHAEYRLANFHIDNEILKVCYSYSYLYGIPEMKGFNSVKSVAKSIQLNGKAGEDKYMHVISQLESLGVIRAKQSIDNILAFDFIINNSDRHLNNIDIVYTSSGNFIAPIFDSGDSLFASTKPGTLKSCIKARLNNTKCKPFCRIHDEQIKIIGNTTLRQVSKEDVHRVLSRYLPKNRVKAIEPFIVQNITKLNLLKGE